MEIKMLCWNPHTSTMYDPMPIVNFTLIRINGHVIRLWTGLKDKNGVDIYEGDIVKCFHDGDAVGNYDVIECNPGAFCFRYRFTTVLQWIDFDGQMEVLGNIYKNPELLKP